MKVLFEGKRAAGVSADINGAVRTFRAAREVILSGGSFNSPQLLLLSGILLPMTFAPGWLRTLSDFNPVKHVLDGMREMFRGHLLTKKSKGRKRALRVEGQVHKTNLDFVKRLLRLK